MTHHQSSHSSGFTIFELIVVVIAIVILLAVVFFMNFT